MKNYLLIESEGVFAAASAAQFLALANDLKQEGNTVEILLVQNGVMSARAGAKGSLGLALKAGIPVLADEMSMRERALKSSDLLGGVAPAKIATVVARMADGWNVIWH